MSADVARPVRVGDDVYDCRKDRVRPVVAIWETEEIAWLRVGVSKTDADAWDDLVRECRHADGAPIDVEASLRIARGETASTVDDTVSGELRRIDDAISEQHIKLASRFNDALVFWFFGGANAGRLFGIARSAADPEKLRPHIEVGMPEEDRIANDLEAARKRIAELEASLAHSRECCADRQEWAGKVDERANRLSDEAGALRTELQLVKVELCDALRTIERLERKGGRR